MASRSKRDGIARFKTVGARHSLPHTRRRRDNAQPHLHASIAHQTHPYTTTAASCSSGQAVKDRYFMSDHICTSCEGIAPDSNLNQHGSIVPVVRPLALSFRVDSRSLSARFVIKCSQSREQGHFTFSTFWHCRFLCSW